MNKHLLSLLLIILFTGLFQKRCFAQANPCTNSHDVISKSSKVGINTIDHTNTTGIACNPNTFFALDNATGEIQELIISGNNAVIQSVVLTGANNGIGFCNNLNGGSFSPTFYSADFSNQPNYYDGTGWVTIAGAPSNLYSQAGNGNTLVYTVAAGNNKDIVKYNGSTFTTIYSSVGARAICVADLAVDNSGNIWFVTTADSTSLIADSVIVISPTGSRIASYPFGFDCTNAYGAFILNNIYYVGYGPAGAFPNTIIGISYSAGIVYVPVSMPGTDYSDLESCKSGMSVGVHEEISGNEWSVYPNPFMDRTTVSFNKEQSHATVKIMDVLGKEIRTQSFSGKEFIIEKGEIKAGVYFIQITDDQNKVVIKKIVIQ